MSLSYVSMPVLGELAVAMQEGGAKYGGFNYRVIGVKASVYFDATFRHIAAWFEGEDIDPASGVNHITKAIASLVVLRDAMIQGNWVDDRPPQTKSGWVEELNKTVEELAVKYPNPVARYTQEVLTPKDKA